MGKRQEHEQAILCQLRIIFKAIQAHSKKVEKLCGLSGAKLWMLHEIATHPGIRVSELARTLSIHPSTCSNMLDKIEDSELVYRDRSRSDQRTVHLFVTDKGTALLAKAPAPPQGHLLSTLHDLSEEQLVNLEMSLGAFIDALHYENNKAALIPIQPT